MGHKRDATARALFEAEDSDRLAVGAMLRAHKILEMAERGYLEYPGDVVPTCPPAGQEIGHSAVCRRLQALFIHELPIEAFVADVAASKESDWAAARARARWLLGWEPT